VKKLRVPLILLLLVAVCAGAFWNLGRNEFIRLDDPGYVTENRQVRSGLTGEGLAWALKTTHAANWHPLTWLSHMIDVQLFGLNPGAQHLVNLFWHAANTVLLFLLLRGMTGAMWRSAIVAALFAVHPLHVESVAWIAERKDVLSTFFWMASSIAYVRYVRSRRAAAYAAALALFALGLMAKPMLVTLPLAFLLLDYWPLGRLFQDRRPNAGQGHLRHGLLGDGARAVVEKLPLLALAAASSLATLRAQEAGNMLRSLTAYPLGVRAENALLSYVRYLGKTLWPAGLALPYGHPGASLTVGEVGAAALLLLVVTALALRLRRRLPYAATGWLWFLGTLVPVIGLIQISDQAMADRYAYVPLIGLFVALAWGAAAAVAGLPRKPWIVATVSCLLLAALIFQTRRQVDFWRDDRSLYEHTARVTKGENLAHVSMARHKRDRPDAGTTMAYVMITMGDDLLRQRKFEEAAEHYQKSLDFYPRQDTAHTRLGAMYLHLGRFDEAAVHYAEVVKMQPNDSLAQANLGLAFKMLGQVDAARQRFQEALRLDPTNQKAIANLRELP
jgi:protein O-mannosyl-transferase